MGSFHNLNVGCANACVIQAPSCTFLVDCAGIDRHVHLLPASKVLKGVFVTHPHRDHYSGLEYLRKNGYAIECLIFSPYDRRRDDNSLSFEEWNEFNDHKSYFSGRGTKLFPAYRQEKFEESYWNIDGVRFWMLGPYKDLATSTTREVHDACLVFKAMMGNRSCLFTGDASDSSLAAIAANTTNMCGDILHASHHGSINGAEESFVKKCAAQYTVISTAPGVYDDVPHPDAIRLYNSHTSGEVYRTDIHGTISWTY